MRILAFVDYYLPGCKGGGPAVSVSRRAAVLAAEHEVFVFTRDRDLGDTSAFAGIEVDAWSDRPEAKVLYSSPRRLGLWSLLKVVRAVSPDVVYLNSFFSRFSRSVLLMKRVGLLRGVDVVLAPRGEFSEGALSLKSFKKRAYLSVVRTAGLVRGIEWQATSPPEREWIGREFPGAVCTLEAEIPPVPNVLETATKHSGECRFVFLGRIARMKNLAFLVRTMRQVRGEAVLTVYGPIEDEAYWQEILSEAHGVRVEHAGSVPQSLVPQSLAAHHVFVLPTLGENFCHAIAEALSVGVPCLISDRTPWNEIDSLGAGWVVPLERPEEWVQRLQYCVDLDGGEYSSVVDRVRDYYSQRHEATMESVRSGEIVPICRAA